MEREKLGPSKAIFLSIKETYNTISMTLSYLGKMIVGKESADQLGVLLKLHKFQER